MLSKASREFEKKETVAKRIRVMVGQVTKKSELKYKCVLDMKVQSESGLSCGSGPS